MDGLNESVYIAVEELSSLEQSRESAIACSRRVIRLTKTVIPKSSICPEPMDRYNSWTAPAATTTT